MGQYLLFAIPFGSVIISPATATIATAHGVVEAIKQSPADTAVFAPSIVAELADTQNAELLVYCAEHLELITYIGGDLPQALGDVVAARVPLHCQYGVSEIGIPSLVFLNGEKTNPVLMEHHIVAHAPELSATVVLGAQRFQAALLVEPTGGC